jgi:DHA3 family macrolide efflux protein-like MFS transporter
MMATFFIMPVAVMFPLLTTGHYGGDKFEMSVIEVIWGIGMLIGGSILGGIRISISKVALVNAAHLLIGLTIAVSGIFPSSWFWVFVAVTGLGGLSMSVFSATFMTIIQQQVKPEYLGRVFSLYFSIAVLPSIIGLLFTGYVAEWIGVASAFIIAGILIMMVGVASFLTPPLMRLGKTKKAAEELVPNA